MCLIFYQLKKYFMNARGDKLESKATLTNYMLPPLYGSYYFYWIFLIILFGHDTYEKQPIPTIEVQRRDLVFLLSGQRTYSLPLGAEESNLQASPLILHKRGARFTEIIFRRQDT